MLAKTARILIVDDDPDVLFAVKLLLKPEVKEVVTEKNPERLLSILAKDRFDVILLDMNYKSALNTGNEGFYWLQKVREKDPEAVVIMITAYGDVEIAVRSLKEGATDFILKPWRNEKLLQTIGDAIDKNAARNRKGAALPLPAETFSVDMIGESEAMGNVFRIIEKIAPTDANVLILGENGTGKELIARAIHRQSLRTNAPFVSVDVGALTDTLFESELFGYKKGAFTDARDDRAGRFETASGGTLFLDEIGNISMAHQAKLLTALQSRQITRLGSNQPVPVNIRLICATNAPIYEMATQYRFRQDLIYRINTVEITIPPLRQRDDDALRLAEHFAQVYAQKYNKPAPQLEEATRAKLRQYHWPGNVRELQHAVERAVIMAERNVLRPDDFPFAVTEPVAESTITLPSNKIRLEDMEKQTILRVIEKHQGNITRAARELGITRTALYRRLEKHDL